MICASFTGVSLRSYANSDKSADLLGLTNLIPFNWPGLLIGTVSLLSQLSRELLKIVNRKKTNKQKNTGLSNGNVESGNEWIRFSPTDSNKRKKRRKNNCFKYWARCFTILKICAESFIWRVTLPWWNTGPRPSTLIFTPSNNQKQNGGAREKKKEIKFYFCVIYLNNSVFFLLLDLLQQGLVGHGRNSTGGQTWSAESYSRRQGAIWPPLKTKHDILQWNS